MSKTLAKLINIDNGGTLTDICVIDGKNIWRTKTLTTPHDLSQCLMDGLSKVSGIVYGQPDLQRLLLSTDYVRYSTTQGTNALVERKGPRLGIIYGSGIKPDVLRKENSDIYDALIGSRAVKVSTSDKGERFDAIRAVSELSAAGANRIVIIFGGKNRDAQERALKRALLKAFPAHLLGAVPLLYSHEVSGDQNDTRRAWTTIFNAFLHPAMERFLYSAERKLRDSNAQNPLLIFRNDGQSSRVAKTVAIKTYSSGPRGGAEGAQKLADHYKFKHLLSVDIGGTTSDVSTIENGKPRGHERGRIENVETSFPLTDVASFGVGGSSVIQTKSGVIQVGPESVGSLPGPACFALGGTEATITDALFVSGLLDKKTYFGGDMNIDIDRAKAAIMSHVGDPLGLSLDEAATAAESAWTDMVAQSVKGYAKISSQTVLAAFGGAGPLLICDIADKLKVNKVFIPKLAAIFSAYGIGFSDIGHVYELPLKDVSTKGVKAVLALLREQAERGMKAEGIDPSKCEETLSLVEHSSGTAKLHAFNGKALPSKIEKTAEISLRLNIAFELPHPSMLGEFSGQLKPTKSRRNRKLLIDGKRQNVPLFNAGKLKARQGANGPAIIEEEFYTCRVGSGWQFEVNKAGDILLSRIKGKA